MKAKYRFTRGFLVVLAILLTVAATACTEPTETPTPTPTATETPVTVEPTISQPDGFSITKDVKILRRDESTEAVKGAKYLLEVIKKLYGFTPVFETDFVSRTATVDPDEFVILVGRTNRSASADELADYCINDYGYRVLNSHTVVIAGLTEDGILEAAKLFCANSFGTTESADGEKRDIPVGAHLRYRATYPVTEMTLCGTPIGEYSVVYGSSEYQKYAEEVANRFAQLVGKQPEVVSEKKFTGTHAIRIKKGGTETDYYIYATDTDVVLEGTADGMRLALNYFYKAYLDGEHTGTVALSVSKEKYIGFTLEEKTNGFVMKSRTDTVLCEGVTYSEIHYEDRDGKPHVAFVVSASPDAVRLELGLPGAAGELNGLATVYDQAVSATQVLGYDIVAAVNADLFSYDTKLPNGTTVYNGQLLREDKVGYQGFAVLKDGSYRFVNNSSDLTRYMDQIQMACGGRYLLMKSGTIVDNGEGDSFCTVRHPRTAFGYKKDGTMLFVVVDGRQAGYSDGASLLDMSMIFYSLGAYEAINLDGGGSSNLILRDGTTGAYYCANHPSETDPYRSVVNTLFFVKK